MMCGVIAGALAAAGSPTPQAVPDRTGLRTATKIAAKQLKQEGKPVSTLPHSGGRTFATLDAYLAYLRDYAAPMDRPWYRETRPGVYRLETANLRAGTEPQEFTREALERRFGFGD